MGNLAINPLIPILHWVRGVRCPEIPGYLMWGLSKFLWYWKKSSVIEAEWYRCLSWEPFSTVRQCSCSATGQFRREPRGYGAGHKDCLLCVLFGNPDKNPGGSHCKTWWIEHVHLSYLHLKVSLKWLTRNKKNNFIKPGRVKRAEETTADKT